MTSTTMKKTKVTFTVIAAFFISSLAVLLGSQQAQAASYAGPVYSSYEACDAARAGYQSSWTRASECYVQYGYDTNTGQNVYLGYSFTVTTP